ncbi:MAG: peptidase M14 [Gemmatimonadales bacterium]|nr:MAG: peptidase M14 [Gemmatimonadales bacterium]
MVAVRTRWPPGPRPSSSTSPAMTRSSADVPAPALPPGRGLTAALVPVLLLAGLLLLLPAQGLAALQDRPPNPGTPALVGPQAPDAEPSTVPPPADVIGFELGSDYMLADLDQLYDYYRVLADASPRVEMEEIGQSVRGEPLYLLYISSEENLAQLDRWQEIAERMARARDLSEEEARELAREGRAIVWIDAGIHSAEVATPQHGPLLAHHMATSESEEVRRIRDDVVMLLMPMINPDGHRIMVDWYRDVARTPFEFTNTPEVWHEYVGHDLNRDWFMIRQEETRHIAHQLYERWYPQIVFNHHQHSPFPTRIFIPPFADPLNPHIDPQVVRGVNLVGEHMGKRFEEEGRPGVVTGITFTMWWNGGMRTAPYFHNQVGLLSEVAHRYASPRYHDPEEIPESIRAGSRELSMTEPSIHYSNPWEGGWARLADAVEYHFVASMGALDIGSRLREDWLMGKWQMGQRQIRAGEEGGPFAFLIPRNDQLDRGEAVELVNVLRRGGVEVHEALASFRAGGETWPAGTWVAPAGQAFRAHLRDLMEPQEHPRRELYPGGPPEPPYGGLAGWTLPMQMAVNTVRIDEPFQVELEPVERAGVPESRVFGGEEADGDAWGWAISGERNASRTAVNALLDAGVGVDRAAGRIGAGGGEFAEGAFVIRGDGQAASALHEEAERLGLDRMRLDRAPDVELQPMEAPRIGLYMPWTGNMDEGWTRYILHEHGFRPDTLRNRHFTDGELDHVDVIVMTDQGAGSILAGHRPGTMPEAYTGGLGEEGAQNLRAWVEAGGTLVTFDAAGDFAISALELPVANAAAEWDRADFFVPGSLVRATFDWSHPVAWGMPDETAVFFQNSRAWEVLDEERVAVVGRYASRNLLMSGWELGADEHLAGRPAVVEVVAGEGRAVLIGFRPQFRAWPTGTYKLFLNPLHGAGGAPSR